MTGYLGTNVYRPTSAAKAPTPVEQLTGTKARRVRNNSHAGPALADRHASATAAWRTPNGAMSGAWVPTTALLEWISQTERRFNDCVLPLEWCAELGKVAVAADRLANSERGRVGRVYVVFSYATPIAWLDIRDDAPVAAPLLTVPDVRYSLTTSRHQSIVRGHGPLTPTGTRDWTAPYVVTGHGASLDDVDPGTVRKGRGTSPFGPRGGAY